MTYKHFIASALLFFLASSAYAQGAVTTDSRIKTLVFSENDVYSILTVYGYQANIEFGEHEEIITVSIGDRIGWQVVPAGRRLFIRAQEESAHTNMTVITSKHAYQFDLKSSADTDLVPSEELSYVIRFYYPDDKNNYVVRDTGYAPAPSLPVAPTVAIPAVDAAPLPTPSASAPTTATPMPTSGSAPNYNYTYTGNPAYAPARVYDDGKNTYVKLNNPNTMNIKFVTDTPASNTSLNFTRNIDGSFIVNSINKSFTIQYDDGQQIQVYNETKM